MLCINSKVWVGFLILKTKIRGPMKQILVQEHSLISFVKFSGFESLPLLPPREKSVPYCTPKRFQCEPKEKNPNFSMPLKTPSSGGTLYLFCLQFLV